MNDILRTRWGGLVTPGTTGTGFFRTQQIDGVWWFVDPDGGLFLSKGVVSVQFDHDNIQGTDRRPYREACQRKYGTRERWRTAVADRLASWGFNTLGAWSEPELAHAGPMPLASAAGVVYLATAYADQRGWPRCDLFDPAFEHFAQQRADKVCAPLRDDPSVLGWFIDNELQWGPDWRGDEELLAAVLSDAAAPFSRAVATGLLRERYKEVGDFNAIWQTSLTAWDELGSASITPPPYKRSALASPRTDRDSACYFADCDVFAGLLAERYMAVSAFALRTAAPHHLILGCRFAYVPQPQVIAAAGRHCDVISLNCYDPLPDAALEAYAATGKPCLIGEFSFRGDDAGLPNSHGAGPRVPTQQERATCFMRYTEAALRQPNSVGTHWFVHADQPAEGRWDGEDSNYGVVTIQDEVYLELTAAMTSLNARAEHIHRAKSPFIV